MLTQQLSNNKKAIKRYLTAGNSFLEQERQSATKKNKQLLRYKKCCYNKAAFLLILNYMENYDNLSIKKQHSVKITFKCSECGKEITQSYFSFKKSNGVCKGCLIKKSGVSKINIKKMKETLIKKYGVDNPSKLREISEKRKSTFIHKYGVDNPSKSTEIKEKIKETNLKKYGVECTLHNDDVAKKVEETMIDRYGCKNSFQNSDIRNKSKATMLKKYGVIYAAQNKEILKKQLLSKRDTLMEQYETHSKKVLQLRGYSFKELKPLLFECMCDKCGNKWLWTNYEWVDKDAYKPILFCSKCFKSGHSMYEDILFKMVPSNIKVEQNNRSVIKPKELDLFFPDNNLAIEFDGDYWHNDSKKTLEKFELCEQKHIRLLNIFEHEFDEKKIKSILYAALNIRPNRVLYARKCAVKEISYNDYKSFCEENHLQNSASAKIRLGLFYGDELVEIMSFNKPRFDKNNEWEMIRECSKVDTSIVGGKAKLFKYFLKNYNPKSVISYCDIRYFTGQSYLDLGFKLDHISKPSYFYIKNDTIYSRYQCQKHLLSKMLENYDPTLTETENMLANGFLKLYDFGQKVFTFKC